MLQFQVRRLSIRFKVKHHGEILRLRFERPPRLRSTSVTVKMAGPESFTIEEAEAGPDGLTRYLCKHRDESLRISCADLVGPSPAPWFTIAFDTDGLDWEVGIEMVGLRSREFWNKMALVHNGEGITVVEGGCQ